VWYHRADESCNRQSTRLGSRKYHEQKGKTTIHPAAKRNLLARFAFVGALAVTTIIAGGTTARAQSAAQVPITISQLAGPWSVSLIGNTGCGWTSLLVTFTLGYGGHGTATYQSHTSGCGDGTTTDVPFVVQTVNANGSGTANLSCGPSCGWQFNIQVSPNREIFSLVDVDPANGGNYLSGTAIRQLR
jgi:hypothetical protein